MFRHQFGQNLILRRDLPLEVSDPFLFGLMVGPASLMKSRGSVLEEPLLLAVEHGRLEPQFVIQIRDRNYQMPSQNGELLFRRVVLPNLAKLDRGGGPLCRQNLDACCGSGAAEMVSVVANGKRSRMASAKYAAS